LTTGEGPWYALYMGVIMFCIQLFWHLLWAVAPQHAGKITTPVLFVHGLGLALFFNNKLGESIDDMPD
jgi:hypothetical protein